MEKEKSISAISAFEKWVSEYESNYPERRDFALTFREREMWLFGYTTAITKNVFHSLKKAKEILIMGYTIEHSGLKLFRANGKYHINCDNVIGNIPKIKANGEFNDFELALDYFCELKSIFRLG